MFINEQGNDEAAKAMNNVYNFVNGSSSIGVTLYIEYIDGKKIEAKEFLEKCKFFDVKHFFNFIEIENHFFGFKKNLKNVKFFFFKETMCGHFI